MAVVYEVVDNGDFTFTAASATTTPVPPVLNSLTRKTPTAALTNADSLTFLATFNEDVTQVSADDFTVNSTSTATVTGVTQLTASTYDITVSGGDLADFNGSLGLNVATTPNIINALNATLANTEPTTDETYTLDNIAPTVAVTTNATNPVSGSFVATYTFSEPVTGFNAVADITVTNGTSTAPVAGAGNTFTSTITPTVSGTVTISIDANVATDAAGNGNNASTTNISITSDIDPPTVEILGAPAKVTSTDPFTATLQFSENVANFIAGDVTATNASVTNFTIIDGDTYTVTITPSGAGDVTILVAAGVAQDAAGNDNLEASLTVANTIVEDTSKIIGSFMEHRATGIANAQPNIGRFLTGEPTGTLAVDGDSNNLTLGYAASVTLNAANQTIDDSFGAVEKASRKGTVDLWTQVTGVNTSAGNTETKLWVGYFGGHTFLSDDMLIGALIQVDFAEEADKAAGSNVDGTGWMIGPYIAGKVTDQSVFYEARAAWGRSDNKVSPFGTYTDSFDTERWMVSGKLSGDFEMGTLTISPNVSLSYFSETQLAYTDSLANLIPSQTLTSGEFRFGPEISNKITLDDGSKLIPKGGLTGIYTYNASTTNAAQTLTLNQGDFRARLDLGLTLAMINGVVLGADMFYDGIGINGYEAWGGQVKLTVPLQ